MYEFSNICLVPRVISTIKSRSDVDTSVKKDLIKMNLPIIASPMRDVCDGKFANKLIEKGCYAIMHRFCTIEEQVSEFLCNKNMAAAIGVNGDYIDRFNALYNAGCRVFCIDVANGATTLVKNITENLSDKFNDVKFIVGNVASKEAYLFVSSLPNVTGVRVGIAGGSACTTKNATGVYYPMASLIIECKSVKTDLMPLIIADGGIKESSDCCKALALGADCVMMGSVLAASTESPAELIKRDKQFYKLYHGSASFEIQKIKNSKPKYIEGRTRLIDYEGESIDQILDRFDDGLRSSMSYFNAYNLEEYRENVTYVVKP